MVKNPQLATLEEVLNKVRTSFARQIEQAEQRLEAARVAHVQRISKSAGRVAELESSLEMFEGFEQERMARQVRTELAAAIEQHKCEVDGANAELKDAMANFIRAYGAAAMGMECAFNAGTAQSK